MSDTQESAVAKSWDGLVRVLVADRSTPFRDAVRRVLDDCANCTLIGEVSNLKEAVGLADQGHPDLALLDFDLLANDKVGQVRRLAEAFPALTVVVLLAEYSEDYRRAVQSCGDKVHFAVQFTRYRADGSVIGHYPSMWIVTLRDGRWGVEARSSFAP